MDYDVPFYAPDPSIGHAQNHAGVRPRGKKPVAARIGRKQPVGKERKRIVKYLAVCRDPKAYKAVVQSAPDAVIKSICDAALNVQRGDRVALNNQQKQLFRKHHRQIEQLVTKSVPIGKKRRALTQRGGAFFIPALIGAAISALGSSLFGGNKS